MRTYGLILFFSDIINNQCNVIVNVFHKHTGLYGLEPDVFLGRVEVPLSSLHFENDVSHTE